MLTGTIDFEKWFGTGGATVTFVAYDPVRYVDDDRTVALGYAAKDVQIMGTYLARPIVAIDIPAACSYVAVSDHDHGACHAKRIRLQGWQPRRVRLHRWEPTA